MSRFHWLELQTPEKKNGAPASEGYDAEFYLARAREKFLSGEFEPALRYYSRALEQEHLLEEAWVGQVRCLVELGEFSEAVVWSDRALQLFPGNASLLAAKALAFGRKGELDKALAMSDASLKAGADKGWFVWWARGDILILTNAMAAEHCFRKAREAGKDSLELSLGLAKSYLSAGGLSEANKLLLASRGLGEANPQFWFFLGLSAERLGELEPAKKHYLRALSIRPEYAEAKAALQALYEKGLFGKVSAQMKKLFRS